MLQKVMVIGLGGSGVKTLRFLRADLLHRLEMAGYEGGLPSAWQLIGIDSEVRQGSDPDLPPELPIDSFFTLTEPMATYRDYDERLMTSTLAADDFRRWRADPARSNIDPSQGLAQFRAIGRAVTAVQLERIATPIEQAILDMSAAGVNQQLDAVGTALGCEEGLQATNELWIVVASIAGGTGAGAFYDVCDLLRLKAAHHSRNALVTAVLYTPEVFEDLPPNFRMGMVPNALASLSEIVNGSWNDDPSRGQPYHTRAGVTGGLSPERGPMRTILVGRRNDKVVFPTASSVFGAIGGALASLVADDTVQGHLNSYLIGNWFQSAQVDSTVPRHPKQTPKQVSALGFAKVGLGSDRFAAFAKQRLARVVVDHLMSAHVNADVRAGRLTEEAALDALVDEAAVVGFVNACGLNEVGLTNNQIVDAVLPSMEDQRKAIREQLRNEIIGTAPELEANAAFTRLQQQIRARRDEYLDPYRLAADANLRAWIVDVQARVLDQTLRSLGQRGLPATLRLLTRVDDQMEVVISELVDEANTQARTATGAGQTFLEQLGRIGSVIPTSHGKLRQLLDTAIEDHLTNKPAAEVKEKIAKVVASLRVDLLQPLIGALELAGLDLREHHRVTRGWPSGGEVPAVLLPGQNEVLLDPADSWEDVLAHQLRITLGDRPDPVLDAARSLIAGSEDGRWAPVVRAMAQWVPPGFDPQSLGAQPAVFDVQVAPDRLLATSRSWLGANPNLGIGRYLEASLADHLAAEELKASERKARIDRFASCLGEALDRSLPLASLNVKAATRAMPTLDTKTEPMLSTIPFGTNHPAFGATQRVLLQAGFTRQQVADMCRPSQAQSVEIASLFALPTHPGVLSAVSSMVGSWHQRSQADGSGEAFWMLRRARPITESVPLPASTIHAMIRGWSIGRLTGAIQLGDPASGRPTTISRTTDGREEILAFAPILPGPLPTSSGVEHLAAVLEGYFLAELEWMADIDRTKLAAYEALYELGRPDAGWDMTFNGANQALRAALQAHGSDAAQVEAVRASFIESLEATIAAVEMMRAGGSPMPLSSVLRAWDLAESAETAMREILTALSPTGQSPTSVPSAM